MAGLLSQVSQPNIAVQMRTEVVLAGEGGQGLVLAGTILGEAAVLFEGKHAVATQSYGVATRGGFSKSEVVISSGEIAYPMAMNPDLVVALTQEAYELFAPKLLAKAVLIYEAERVKPASSQAKQLGLNLIDSAFRLGSIGNTNLVALGAVAACGVVGLDSLKSAVKARFGESRAVQLKLDALDAGFELVLKMRAA